MFIVIRTVTSNQSITATATAVGFIYDEGEFPEFIEKLNCDVGPKYIQGIDIKTLKTDSYEDGFYLIDGSDSNEIILINKYRTLSKGYFYTSTYINTDMVSKWSIIPFDGEANVITKKTTESNEDKIFSRFMQLQQ